MVVLTFSASLPKLDADPLAGASASSDVGASASSSSLLGVVVVAVSVASLRCSRMSRLAPFPLQGRCRRLMLLPHRTTSSASVALAIRILRRTALRSAATGEEVGDAVLGVGEPLGEAGEEGSEEAAGEAGLIGCRNRAC